MIILGAGMGGCIAAILNAGAEVLEASPTPPTNHNAVLRFRTDAISKVTGIPFKRVTVNKAIYHNGKLESSTTPKTANLYSKKVSGKILSRSIWNLDTVERFIAPPDFHSQLIKRIGTRITYGLKVQEVDEDGISTVDADGNTATWARQDRPIISTLPMPVLAKVAHLPLDSSLFGRLPICTARCSVPLCDVNQTIYFPDPETRLYRATLTGGELILEFTGDHQRWVENNIPVEMLSDAFGIDELDPTSFSIGTQQYGKIAPVPDSVRKAFMFEATRRLGIYSLGRFGVWRNILLDDVYEDVFQIRRMIEQSHYDLRAELVK